MIKKKTNKYKIVLQEIELKDETYPKHSVKFEFENRDNIVELINKMQNSGKLEDNHKSAQFILGLKLFGETIMQNKKNPLFEEITPVFVQFMKKLKEK